MLPGAGSDTSAMSRRSSFITISSRSSSRVSVCRKGEPILPYANIPDIPEKPKPRIRVRTLLGHCLYRRVLLWALTLVFLGTIGLLRANDGKGVDVGRYHIGLSLTGVDYATATVTLQDDEEMVVVTGDFDGDGKLEVQEEEELLTEEEQKEKDEQLKKMPWLRFPHLDGYFHGIKTVVAKTQHVPEYPNKTQKAPLPKPPKVKETPKPTKYNPYNHSKKDHVQTCYLDYNNTIPAPDIYAYNGVPQHMPDPALGSYDLLGMRDDVCFDRFGRYGPYGLGYTKIEGGSGVGRDTESEGSQAVWEETDKIDYNFMDWGDAQDRCFAANKHRFREIDDETGELKETSEKKGRIAVVVRAYTGFRWTEHAILNFRAMINELSLRSGGEYAVHLLMQVRNTDLPIFSDDQTVEEIIDANVPAEFRSLVTLWSESQMKLFYPGRFDTPLSNPSNADVHGIYRSAHLPLQVFAMQHPEYEHFWNWEMDMRYLGSYYEFFDRVGGWAAEQPRPLLWERSAKYYIPAYHGSWENFTATVQRDTVKSGRTTVFGPVDFDDRKPLRFEEEGRSAMPESCSARPDQSQCGVGEAADLITLNPMFDVEDSGWVFTYDITGWRAPPPRRCAIITASRLSRRLLMAMHEEVWRHHRTMFSEMFPPSVALHHGFKATYAPHPIFLDRAWSPFGDIDAAFNGGRDGSTSGRGSPFDLRNEHNHRGASWYFNSEFSGLLWRRWLGYAQKDGRGKLGGRAGEGVERGGRIEEMQGTGRMCLRGMLVHPIKYEHPVDG